VPIARALEEEASLLKLGEKLKKRIEKKTLLAGGASRENKPNSHCPGERDRAGQKNESGFMNRWCHQNL